jgi:hypothetical protein
VKPVVLTVGDSGSPWFGPRVFDDASMCPAKAAISLQGFGLPAGSSSEPLAKLSGGAWLAAANLLRELAQRGRTSAYATGKHPVKTFAD